MNILLIKPRPTAVQFGLAPFFQTEPLGLEYIAAELERQGHSVATMDLRFERRRLSEILRTRHPAAVGIACLHILDAPATLKLADEIKTLAPWAFVAVGGHAASSYPQALTGSSSIDAICLGEGERVMPALCDALTRRQPLTEVCSLLLRQGNDGFSPTPPSLRFLDLSQAAVPDRRQVAPYQKHYCCLNYMPVWTLETTRGCPHRCRFCQFYRGSCRFHSPASVRADFEACGHNVFIIDDIFWAESAQSEALARALLASPERKNWILAQSRVDLVAASPELLQRWRPLAKNFDIFFGFESPTGMGLDKLNKGTDVATTVQAIRTARELGYGVTGNFIIDPDFTEDDFGALWDFLETHQLNRVGFTILTPLPGTQYFESIKSQLLVFDWNQYDLHHLLWRPHLPPERFFELYSETWRRSVLNLGGTKKLATWLRQVHPRQIPRLARILWRTQKLMQPGAYVAECRIPCRH
jgi:radical SAM superfamily enzyme YgiQ (UPF0313 family)